MTVDGIPGAQSQPVVDPAGLVARLVGSPAGQALAKGGAAHGFEAVVARPAVKGGVEVAGLAIGRHRRTADPKGSRIRRLQTLRDLRENP